MTGTGGVGLVASVGLCAAYVYSWLEEVTDGAHDDIADVRREKGGAPLCARTVGDRIGDVAGRLRFNDVPAEMMMLLGLQEVPKMMSGRRRIGVG